MTEHRKSSPGNVVGTTHYDEKGYPLSGICGDFMKWEMLDSHTIKISGNGDMDDFTTMAPPLWQCMRLHR